MSRPKLPPRLVLRADRPTAAERAAGATSRNVWIIKDGDKFVRTGCAESETARAEGKLAAYLGQKHEPRRVGGKAADLSVGDILTVYAVDKAPGTARPKETLAAIERLEDFWGEMSAAEIIGANCRSFTQARGTASGARRDLEVLRAAVKHYKAEHGMEFEPIVTLPRKSDPRERWLTRSEVAALLWACLRPQQDGKGRHRKPRRKHLARFILIAVYTATRHEAILGMQWHPNTVSGWFDLDAGRMHRRAPGVKQTKKRRPVARIPDRLAAHLRRWRKIDGAGVSHVVNFHGEATQRQKRAFRAACKDAGLDPKEGPPDVVPHTLRHTAITWLMQAGAEVNDVAGFAGVTVEELERTYFHHHPDFQDGIARTRMGKRAQRPETSSNARNKT